MYELIGLYISFAATSAMIYFMLALFKKANINRTYSELYGTSEKTPVLAGVSFSIGVIITLFILSEFIDSLSIGLTFFLVAIGFIGYLLEKRKINRFTFFILLFIIVFNVIHFGINRSETAIITSINIEVSILAALISTIVVYSFVILDSIDGLISSISTLIFLFFGILFLKSEAFTLAWISFACAGSAIAIKRYNIAPSKIKPGISGSIIFGGLISIFCFIYIVRHSEYHSLFDTAIIPTIILIIPFLNIFWLLFNRIFELERIDSRKFNLYSIYWNAGIAHRKSIRILLYINICAALSIFLFSYYDTALLITIYLSLTAFLLIYPESKRRSFNLNKSKFNNSMDNILNEVKELKD